MDKCKFCHQELAEDSTVCPHCGKDNAIAEEEKKNQPETAENSAEEAEAHKEEPTVKPEEEAKQEAPAEDSEVKEETSEEKEEASEEKKEPTEEKEEASENKEEASEEKKEFSEEKAESAEKPEDKSVQKGATPGQITLAVIAIVALAAILVALIVAAVHQKKEDQATVPTTEAMTEVVETTEATIPADGNPDDVTCKGTYTAEAEELKAASDEVVANMAEFQLTNSQLQIYYWKGIQAFLQSNPYAPYLVDMNSPLDSQHCAIADGLTWQQFFLQEALNSWQNYQSMAAEAEANEMKPTQEIKDFIHSMPSELEKQAVENGFQDAEEMLAANVGPGSSVSDYVDFMEIYQMGMGFYVHFLEVAQPDDEEMETYFNENQTALEEGGITKDAKSVNVRHILISPEDTESEDAWKAAEEKAQGLLKSFEDGDRTEDSFAALATEHSQDPGSQQTGGLYQHVMLGQMVPEFDQWCFDDQRQVGDTGLVKTSYGYHVMYYAGDQLTWKDQVANIILNEKSDDLIERNAKTYPMVADYSKILLGIPVMPEIPEVTEAAETAETTEAAVG